MPWRRRIAGLGNGMPRRGRLLRRPWWWSLGRHLRREVGTTASRVGRLGSGLAPGLPTRRRRRPGGIRLLGDRGPGQSGRPGIRRRSHLGWPAGLPLLRSDREGQPRPLRIPDVDALAVVDVDHRHPVAVDVGPVQRAVVDCQPSALIEAQDQMRAGYPGVRDAQVGVQVASDNHLMTCSEGTLGPVVLNGQHGRGGSTHYSSIGPRREWAPWDPPVTSLYFDLATHSRFIASSGPMPMRVRHHSNVRGARGSARLSR